MRINGDLGAAAPRLAAPALKDEAPGGASAEGSRGQARTNGADSGTADIEKTFAALQAHAAMAGHELRRHLVEDGGCRYVMARWGMHRDLAGLDDVRAWVEQATGRKVVA